MWTPFHPSIPLTVGTRIRFYHFYFRQHVDATVTCNQPDLFRITIRDPRTKDPLPIGYANSSEITKPTRELQVFDTRLCPKEIPV